MRIHSLLLVLSSAVAVAADWPQWRGPNRDGKSPETGLLREWPTGGPKLVWKTTGLGDGFASVSVTGGRVFTMGQVGEKQIVMAFDAATGKKLWEVPNGEPYRERRGDGPRGVPTVEGGRLWTMTADGTLSCLETATGKRVWSANMVSDFGGAVPHWGYSESPLIEGDMLIVNAGGKGTSVLALNKNTGKAIWKSQSDPAGYASAMAATVGGVRQIFTFTAKGAMGLNAKNGELLWRYDNVSNRTANIATPIIHNDHVFYSSAYGTGAALLKLTARGGGVEAKEVYFTAEMMNHYSTSVLLGEHLYGYSNAILTAMKFMTGEVAWKDRSVGKGSVIYADGLLYAIGEDGMVGLIEPSPEGYKERARFTFPKSERKTWAPLAIADGHLFIRDQDTLYCHLIR